MSFVQTVTQHVSQLFPVLQSEQTPDRIGIYGPANAGKTTLANRISKDWAGESIGSASHIPHETRKAKRKENIEIEQNGQSVTIDIVDTPGVETNVNYKEFTKHGMKEDAALQRSREATEGIAEAMHWLKEDVDGVLYVMDSTEDPFTQVNTMLLGIIESQNLPAIVFANKIDKSDAQVSRIENAFPQHTVLPISALDGKNIEQAYETITAQFG
jgi:small GTP-binding protein